MRAAEHCDSNPAHAPAFGVFTLAARGAVYSPLCDDCLKHRVSVAIDHAEEFHAGSLGAVFPQRLVAGIQR